MTFHFLVDRLDDHTTQQNDHVVFFLIHHSVYRKRSAVIEYPIIFPRGYCEKAARFRGPLGF